MIALALSGCAGGGPFSDRSDLVAEPSNCMPQQFEIYFSESEARLTESARQAIGMTAAQLQGCEIKSVRVLGLASATGDSQANTELSERRAVAVQDALVAAGWPSPAFSVEAVGDAGAVNADGTTQPLRRRTEVVVDAGPAPRR